jgi:hypothetical protein
MVISSLGAIVVIASSRKVTVACDGSHGRTRHEISNSREGTGMAAVPHMPQANGGQSQVKEDQQGSVMYE